MQQLQIKHMPEAPYGFKFVISATRDGKTGQDCFSLELKETVGSKKFSRVLASARDSVIVEEAEYLLSEHDKWKRRRDILAGPLEVVPKTGVWS